MTKQLKFICGDRVDLPITGKFTTCRAGDKWFNSVSAEDLLEVWICEEPHFGECGDCCEDVGVARVINIWNGPFNLLPMSFILYEHAPECRTLQGLFARMKKIYPDFHLESEVTFLYLDKVS